MSYKASDAGAAAGWLVMATLSTIVGAILALFFKRYRLVRR